MVGRACVHGWVCTGLFGAAGALQLSWERSASTCNHMHDAAIAIQQTGTPAATDRCTRRYYIVRSLLCTCVCCMKACMLAMRCRLHCLPLYSFHALLSLQHPGLFSRPCSFPLPVPIRNLHAYFSTLRRLGRDSIL